MTRRWLHAKRDASYVWLKPLDFDELFKVCVTQRFAFKSHNRAIQVRSSEKLCYCDILSIRLAFTSSTVTVYRSVFVCILCISCVEI